MLDFFYSLTPIYSRLRSQMTHDESCENVIPLPHTGADYRIMICLDKNGKINSSNVVEKNDGIVAYRIDKNNVAPRIRISNFKKDEKNLNKSISKFVGLLEQIINVFEDSPQELPKTHPIRSLHARLVLSTADPFEFLKEICSVAKKTVEDSINNPEKIIDEDKIDVIFDIDSDNDFQSSMTDIAKRKKLLNSKSQDNSTKDMFGNSGKVPEDTYGMVHNWFKLYDRNDDVGAFSSYGLNSVQACPLTATSRNSIHDVAVWAISNENKSKLWNRRFSGKKEDIIIIVPDLKNPEEFDKISSVCSDLLDDEEDFFANILQAEPGNETYKKVEESIASYTAKSAAAVATLNGLIKEDSFAKFKGIIASKAGKKDPFGIISNLEFSALKLRDAIDWWQECCATSVTRSIPKFFKGKFVGFYEHKPAHPFQIPRIMNIHWTTGAGISGDGSLIPKYCDKITFERFSQENAISLFLDKNVSVANRIIKEFVEHHSSLMLDVARRSNRNEWPCLIGNRFDVFQLPSIMSAALSVKGITKMDRENNVGFILGQMLGIADWLHSSRCYARNENLPAELIGSRFTPIFSGRYKLSDAFRNFGRDFLFIEDWCKAVVFKNEIKNVSQSVTDDTIIKYKWFHKLASKIASSLPERLSSEDAAMFTLGYYSVSAFYPQKQQVGNEVLS